MTKILNFALKIKGGGRKGGTCEVLRPCHPPKFGTCTKTGFIETFMDNNCFPDHKLYPLTNFSHFKQK